ncbi:MAG: crossover junction endodeoxyribonuclease RuvC [Proteobacteria bacterium]|nr:crossover junction endodeoxyribonuclease RuvC [Pseudomonadota bacterium]
MISDNFKILGIDPGLKITGYGLINKHDNNLKYLTSGVIKSPADEKDLSKRLKVICRGLKEIIDTYKPDCVSIEKVFVNVNPHTTLLLGQARGAAISVSVLNDLDVYEYTALQIKKSVVGNGHAAKEQVQMMVKKLLDLPALTSKDSADALACAICHANISQALQNFNVGTRMKGGRFV